MEADEARRKATELLARREFTRAELGARLAARGGDSETIAEVLDELQEQGVQSDARFCESFVRGRIHRGHGPNRVRAELARRGVADELIDDALEHADVDWPERAREVRRKRFGSAAPEDYTERARQMRFLHYRGFDTGHIQAAFRHSGD